MITWQYPGTAFKVPTLSKWLIVVSGSKRVDDIRRVTDDQLNSRAAAAEVFRPSSPCYPSHVHNFPLKTIQSEYTVGPELRENLFHVATVRSPLTRALTVRFSDVQDEIACGFNDFIPPTEGLCLLLSSYSLY
jgi:hypothetical protein